MERRADECARHKASQIKAGSKAGEWRAGYMVRNGPAIGPIEGIMRMMMMMIRMQHRGVR